MDRQSNARMCFICGSGNPIGLKLRCYGDEEERCIAHFRPSSEHQDFPGQLHGGTFSALLDGPLRVLYTLVSSRYDSVLLDLGDTRGRQRSADRRFLRG